MGRRDDPSSDDGYHYDDDKKGAVDAGSDGDADQAPHFDPSKNLRFRHEVAVLVAVGVVATLDFALAGVMAYDHFGNPTPVWGIAVAISLVEGLYVAVTAALIEFHVGATRHLDMVLPLVYVLSGSLAVNVIFVLGALDEKGTHPVLFPTLVFLVVASQAAGLALSIVGVKTHILLLLDPHPEAHGYHPHAHRGGGRHRGWRHRHGRHRDRGSDGDDA
ncbi:hypothetical protein DMC30DRAFT_304439 [Rhodotorula diobovata]|uniref:Uncharacterized protein n=1 Tax=Rhodotorula diobovata TaxID=5288 RepID=A0A5C5FRD3_9BASI|nr:hypothetical protein DMC30DRAFT_304439 [Rhodotorula diobovata]